MLVLQVIRAGVVGVTLLFFFFISDGYPQVRRTIEEGFPGLATKGLKFALLSELPKDILLVSGNLTIKESEITSTIRQSKPVLQTHLKKNTFYVLEDLATKRLLLREAMTSGRKSGSKEDEIINNFLRSRVHGVSVSDEELQRFYLENRALVGNMVNDQFRESLREFLKEQKKEEAKRKYTQNLGRRLKIFVNTGWVKKQSHPALDNSLDQARRSGKPSVIVFGAVGDCPCDMVSPILTTLRKKFANKLNLLLIQVREEKVLALRYDIQSLPTYLFFNEKGWEVHRHVGFLPEADLENMITRTVL